MTSKLATRRVVVEATRRVVVETHTANITVDDIRAAFGLPTNAQINFYVPGGGDWSNCAISLDDQPLTVVWHVRHGEEEI
jgi:hypothetical protein